MISKKLLMEVMGYKNPNTLEVKDNTLYLYKELGQNITTLNIYELAHKCKEWAFDTSYLSIIVFKMNDDLYKCEIADIRDSIGVWSTKYSFKAESEQYAVFEACQWILDR